MRRKRLERINELLRRELADALFREMTESGFDLASVTVTRVRVSSDLRKARVSVSVFGDERHREAMLALLRRHRARLQQFVNRDLTLKYTPVLYFEADTSLAEGDRILRLMEELPPPAAGSNGPEEEENREDTREENPPVS